MSYLKRTTLQDFDEAYRYGAKITLDDLGRLDKLIDKIANEFGVDSPVVNQLLMVRSIFENNI